MCSSSRRPINVDLCATGFEEFDHALAIDGAEEKSEVEVPEGQSGNRRELMPFEVVLDDRSVPTSRPSARHGWPLGEARLVDEHDHASVAGAVFFSAGQRYRFQWVIACSLRSRALPSGFWQETPICPRPLGARFATACDDNIEIRESGIRNEDLDAIDHLTVAIASCRCLQCRYVGTGEGGDLAAGYQRWQVMLSLLRAAQAAGELKIGLMIETAIRLHKDPSARFALASSLSHRRA